MSLPFISFVDVNKVYPNGVKAVIDFNLDIYKHEFIVLVGPSGCGKSTTLRMLAGLEDISHGTLFINGEIVNNLTPKERDLAMVFQSYALYPHMSIYNNRAFGLRMRPLLKPEQCIVVEDAKAGIDAALAGGFIAVGMGDAYNYEKNTYSIKELKELLLLVRTA